MQFEAQIVDAKPEKAKGGQRAPKSLQANVVALTANDARQWTLKGIPQVAVDVSREAAKKSGMKLNSWVSKALQDAADDVVSDAASRDTDVARKVADLEEYIRTEMAKLRAHNEQMESTINSISSILLKLYAK